MVAILNMGSAKGVLPQLEYVIDKLAVKKPLYVFQSVKTRCINTALNQATDEVEDWVSQVEVFQDAELVGSIEYANGVGRMDSMGVKPDAFVVRTTHINKARGRLNAVVTINPDVAVKTTLKHFAPATQQDICKNIMSDLSRKLESVLYASRTCLGSLVSFRDADACAYFVALHLNKGVLEQAAIPLPPSLTVREDMLHLYDVFLAGKNLSQYYGNGTQTSKGYVVWELPDSSIYVLPTRYSSSHSYQRNLENGVELKRYRNFEDLPISIQERVAVLKIANDKDPIMDVGVKLRSDDNLMYVTE
jgi:hypothetical protein